MPIVRVNTLSEPGLEVYGSLTERQLKVYSGVGELGLFIAESPKVIHVALDAGYEPVSLLCEEKHVEGDAKSVIARCPDDMPVYVGERQSLASLTGYTLTRGVLCAMRRKVVSSVGDVCCNASRVVVINGVVDTTNIGAIFRSAAALGMDAVILTPACSDPLYRRAIRVSMGTVFQIPWTYVDKHTVWPEDGMKLLRELGFKTAAFALKDDSVGIDDPQLMGEEKLAILLGTEGDGLATETIADCDYTVRIPMSHGVDSLNVAAASAVAFWQLGNHN